MNLYPRDRHGRFSKFDSKGALVSMTFLGLMVMTLIHANNARKTLNTSKIEVVPEVTTSTHIADNPCVKVAEREWDCTDEKTKQAIIKWAKDEWAKREEAEARKVKITVSAYTSEIAQTDDSPEIAANGKNIWHMYQKGIKTCASNDFKMGTKLKIDGLGTCIISDRMNKRYTGTNTVDWYMGYSKSEALKFGRKVAVAEIVK